MNCANTGRATVDTRHRRLGLTTAAINAMPRTCSAGCAGRPRAGSSGPPLMTTPIRVTRLPRSILRGVTGMLSAPAVAEMAVPSYCHRNPLIRRLFWRRLDRAWRLAGVCPGENVFDFGIGSGVLLATLKPLARWVAGSDLHLAPARAMAAHLKMAVELID